MAIFRGSDELSNYQRGPTIQFLVIYPYPWKLNESCTKNVQKWIIPYIVGFKLSGMLHAAGSCTYILAFFESILEKKKQNHGAALGMEPFPVTCLNSAIVIIMVYHDNHCRHGGGGRSHKLLSPSDPHPETLVWHSFWHSPFLEVLYKAYLFHRQKCSK